MRSGRTVAHRAQMFACVRMLAKIATTSIHMMMYRYVCTYAFMYIRRYVCLYL